MQSFIGQVLTSIIQQEASLSLETCLEEALILLLVFFLICSSIVYQLMLQIMAGKKSLLFSLQCAQLCSAKAKCINDYLILNNHLVN